MHPSAPARATDRRCEVTEFHGVVIPTRKVDGPDLEAAVARAVKLLRDPLELRDPLPVPQGVEDTERGQFRASNLMTKLRTMVPQLGPGKLIGTEGTTQAKAQLKPGGYVFVTDVDLFTEKSDGIYAALLSKKKLAIVSVRRLREAFYRRKADPVKQRTRLVKEIVRMTARLRGMPACADPQCVLAPSKMLADLDLKEEKLCRGCSQWMFSGSMRI
jgi:predicted Zn-dependent protease